MATVFIPPLLRGLSGGKDQVEATGATVGQIVEHLERIFPGMGQRLCDGDRLRAGMAVMVDEQVAPRGLLEAVKDNSEVHFVPAIGGGQQAGKA